MPARTRPASVTWSRPRPSMSFLRRSSREGERDRGGAGREPARCGKDGEAGPVAGIVTLRREEAAERIRGVGEIGLGLADGMGAHQGRRGLAEGAGLYLLPQRDDPPLP